MSTLKRLCPSSRQRARQLRASMTRAESALWAKLRRRQVGGYRFRRQHPLGHYVVDFVCLEAGLVVEVDGGQHAERREEDAVRTAWLEGRGYGVLRFWNDEVLQRTAEVVEVIARELERRRAPPSRPTEGEEG